MHDRRRRARSASPTPRRRPAIVRASRHGGAGHAEGRRRACSSKSITRGAPSIRANHSATHLLHEALREVLGEHVAQRARWSRRPAALRLRRIRSRSRAEEIAPRRGHRQRRACCENDEVDHAPDGDGRRARSRRARAVRREVRRRGARGLDGQACPRARPNTLGWSVELCGGTHVRRTGDIGLFSVTGEGGVAAGVRRIEAVTGSGARASMPTTRMALAKTAAAELQGTSSTRCRRASPR